MSLRIHHVILAILIAAVAGCIGAYATGFLAERNETVGLHEYVHKELELTPDQTSRLDEIEALHAAQKAELEASLRAANARLAQAIEAEHEYGPEVSAAIDDVHQQMGALQKATIEHVFEMRELLDSEQQELFDRQVSKALTRNPQE